MTGSAIIDLPTIFIGVLALLVLWDTTRTLIALILQLVSMAWMWRYHRGTR